MTIHIAAQPVRIGNLYRQCCAWCGHIFTDWDLANIAVPEGQSAEPIAWPVGGLIEVEGNRTSVVDHEDGQRIPDGWCGKPAAPEEAPSHLQLVKP